MAQHASKRNRRSRNARARGRNRVVGLTGVAGAALALGIGPLGAAPPAKADGFDAIFDAVAGSIANLGDPMIGGAAAATSAEPLAVLGLSADAMSAVSSWDALLHTLEQDWITSSLGNGFDTQLNALWQDLGGTGILIGDGANGMGDGT